MLNAIKKFLGIQEPATDISEENLRIWIEERLKTSHDAIISIVNSISSQINEESIKGEEALVVLEKTELHNPDISTREVQFMIGNREAYCKRTRLFFSQAKIESGNVAEIIDLCNQFEKDLIEYGESTARQYIIIQQFFAHESRDVALIVRKIEQLIKDLHHSIINSEFQKLTRVKEDIDDFFNKKELKATLESEQLITQSSLADLEGQRKKSSEEYGKLEISSDYEGYRSTEFQILEIDKRITSITYDLLHKFSPLEAAFKKLSRIFPQYESLMQGYIENPSDSLINDPNNSILEVLNQVKIHVGDESFELKDRKREKTLQVLSELSAVYLNGSRIELQKNISQKQILQDKLSANSILESMAEVSAKLHEIERQISLLNQAKDKAVFDLSKINIDSSKTAITSHLFELLKERISII